MPFTVLGEKRYVSASFDCCAAPSCTRAWCSRTGSSGRCRRSRPVVRPRAYLPHRLLQVRSVGIGTCQRVPRAVAQILVAALPVELPCEREPDCAQRIEFLHVVAADDGLVLVDAAHLAVDCLRPGPRLQQHLGDLVCRGGQAGQGCLPGETPGAALSASADPERQECGRHAGERRQHLSGGHARTVAVRHLEPACRRRPRVPALASCRTAWSRNRDAKLPTDVRFCRDGSDAFRSARCRHP